MTADRPAAAVCAAYALIAQRRRIAGEAERLYRDLITRVGDTRGKVVDGVYTGELDGPEMVKLLPLIGIERARKRLEKCET